MPLKSDPRKLEIAKQLFYDGKFYREIADETGISLSALQRHSSDQGWERNASYMRNQRRNYLNRVKSTKITKETYIKKSPPVNEHCLLTSCRRLMWLIESDHFNW